MSAAVVIVGQHQGPEVVRFALGHGEDPQDELATRGWDVVGPAVGPSLAPALGWHTEQDPWRVVLAYDVVPRTGPAQGYQRQARVVRDIQVSPAQATRAVARQRLAAYAVISWGDCVLLTELSGRTNAPGRWTFPGGGLEDGEDVEAGLRREVWEESNQHIEQISVLGVQSSHWIGAAPNGILEDFHAVRLVHIADCPRPRQLRVHDVGGSTSAAAWIPWKELTRWPVVASFAPVLTTLASRHRR
ncbi:MAG: NUDIX hydrolase [Nostocoides sp.]